MGKQPIPIVTARGIMRFDILRELLVAHLHIPEDSTLDNLHYFKGIKSFLGHYGYKVFHTDVSWADHVETRALQLAAQIEQVLQREGANRVHLLAHSMGALDARYMLVNVPGMAAKVALLTTIGGPHHGTVLADMFLESGGSAAIQALQPIIHLDGLEDLTRSAAAAFNEQALDQEAGNPVIYQTYSSLQADRDLVFLPLQLGWTILQEQEGPNDGVVSVRSQEWCSELVASNGTRKPVIQKRFPFSADHLNQCGWWDPNELHDKPITETMRQQMQAYESRIKQIYLEIARSGDGL